ncbi:MAG: SAM-dependent DNA methyltransferase [Acidobacteria bacterium]|nr:SAM-dependent DNA methyltransferase [Acidobacteriota bacterium]
MEGGQTRSKQRVSDHGEVYTNPREVNAMLDLVKQETERIDSRFLEPACGHGNFLTAILERKLDVVEERYKKSQLEFERYSVLAVGSIYGIDLLEDNVAQARERLLHIFTERYSRLFKAEIKADCIRSIQFILEKNIVVGDALEMTIAKDSDVPIVFSEWSLVNGSSVKRRDFAFEHLSPGIPMDSLFKDTGEEGFIPKPIREFPLTHFLKIADVTE